MLGEELNLPCDYGQWLVDYGHCTISRHVDGSPKVSSAAHRLMLVGFAQDPAYLRSTLLKQEYGPRGKA